jgi:hypothetical protein
MIRKLGEIPLFDVTEPAAVALIDRAPHQLHEIITEGRRHYGGLALRLGDRASWQWLVRTGNPYRHEIAAVAARVSLPGAFLLNLSYEWSCTAGVGCDPAGMGNRLLRTLDWPMHGLGRNVVVARQAGEAGLYYNVTWPGLVGILTAMAPARFSAAINQPPMDRHTPSCWFDWLINRTGVWRKGGLPPSHLLRRVFDHCRTYAEARALLIQTPLCIPAFFSLSGVAPDEGCVIERLEHQARVHPAPTSIANHWLSFTKRGHDRGSDSVGRKELMDRLRDQVGDNLDWVIPPILNITTLIAVVANAKRGSLVVRGWERDGPATCVFNLAERLRGDKAQTTPIPEAAERT